MKKNLLSFLFGESQMDDEIAAIVESIADLDAGDDGDLKVAKKPLADALSSLDIDPKGLENDPRGLSLVFTDAEAYRSAHAILNEPDSLHKLAQLGWVFSTQGDVAMANEPAEFRIRFLEIDNVESYDAKASYSASDKARLNKAKEIIKQGREFATTEPEHDEDCNPVEFSDPKDGGKKKGVGKEKDGADPEGKPKGSDGGAANKSGSAPGKGGLTQPKEGTSPKAVKENKDAKPIKCPKCGRRHGYGTTWCPCGNDISDSDSAEHKHVYGKVERSRFAGTPHRKCSGPGCKNVSLDLDDSVEEAGHKSGCQCGFCKNKGNIGNWKKGKKKKDEDEDGTSGQDRKSYTDTQDRKNYTVDPNLEQEESLSATEIVNSMLEGNPGTPPGIMGTKSFSTMKVPGGSTDRKFRPAKGMVQAAPEGSVVAKQTKPNRRA